MLLSRQPLTAEHSYAVSTKTKCISIKKKKKRSMAHADTGSRVRNERQNKE